MVRLFVYSSLRFFVLVLDTGFFSIQVLQKALEVFDIELVPYASQHPSAQQARADPQSVQAYICNLREHWLTIRRFGTQYFDLNSISTVPKLISNTYLSLYLAQLQQSGYSIFIINGILTPCTADEKLLNSEIDPVYYRSLTDRFDVNRNENNPNKKSKTSPESPSSFDDKELQRALKASVELDNSEDKALQQVLAQSLRDAHGIDDPTFYHHEQDPDALNQKLLDQAIAASLTNDSPSVTQPTTAEPTIEGKIIGSREIKFIYPSFIFRSAATSSTILR